MQWTGYLRAKSVVVLGSRTTLWEYVTLKLEVLLVYFGNLPMCVKGM